MKRADFALLLCLAAVAGCTFAESGAGSDYAFDVSSGSKHTGSLGSAPGRRPSEDTYGSGSSSSKSGPYGSPQGSVRARVKGAVDLIQSYGGTDTFLKVYYVNTRNPYPLFLCEHCGRQCDLCEMITKNNFFAPVETGLFDFLLSRSCSTFNMGARGGGLVVDVGANIGYFTLLAANYGCRVQAFEPHELNLALLRSSIALNELDERVRLHQVALGSDEGTSVLKGYGAFATLQPNGTDVKKWQLGEQEAMEQPGVAVRKFQEYIEEDVLLLKIDTEGYEKHVLDGSWDAWRRVTLHNVLVEVKLYKTPEKLGMLRQLMMVAGLKYAYTYKERYTTHYGALADVKLEGSLMEVTNILLEGDPSDKEVDMLHEDFLLRREPMPSRYVVYARPSYGSAWVWLAVLLLVSAPVCVYVAFTAEWCITRARGGRQRLRQLRRGSRD